MQTFIVMSTLFSVAIVSTTPTLLKYCRLLLPVYTVKKGQYFHGKSSNDLHVKHRQSCNGLLQASCLRCSWDRYLHVTLSHKFACTPPLFQNFVVQCLASVYSMHPPHLQSCATALGFSHRSASYRYVSDMSNLTHLWHRSTVFFPVKIRIIFTVYFSVKFFDYASLFGSLLFMVSSLLFFSVALRDE